MKPKKRKKKQKKGRILKGFLTFLGIIVTLVAISAYMLAQNKEFSGKAADWLEQAGAPVELTIPEEYIDIYQRAEDEYGVPWTLLAAHHRVETRFSTMETMVSPVGAEGHMQFMPCTFVGWSHPTCEGLGQGDIPENELTDLAVIEEFGGYGVDGSGNGKADPWDIEDAIFSAANYLSQNGAADGDFRRAIFKYNHSDQYVENVMSYFEQYEKEYNLQDGE
ncbi:lytic transglycosylase domain-containing protein [Jeotgalibacillus proteolyticus]|uniref:Transglycosylase SLT domain-containing protein n=1 Tax=Jeotgalibacillus proteolyticus TaxID=2082395 RepID=A0A2S5GFY9_9BACL|nr:lytic transglycosylase domain-containing protein [Jeotgalibacillus proteolyticus]PPA71950.1 hypothetical protein C4B60_00805 [Jeotgalibacillus proteolyticus]